MKFSKNLLPALALLFCSSAFAQISTFCPALPNSTGLPTVLAGSFSSGYGSGLHLEVTDCTPAQFGYFLVGNEATPPIGVSNGLLCLVGSPTARVYRYNVVGGVLDSVGLANALGVVQNFTDTSITGSGFDVPVRIPVGAPLWITAGETWHFQYWHRDGSASSGQSNFSNGLSVTFGALPPTPTPVMVPIPAGTFVMGSAAIVGHPHFVNSTELPAHQVTISYPFWMGQYEVTQLEYVGLMETNPTESFLERGPTFPIVHVSWQDAVAYCQALTAHETSQGNVPSGYEYRLPTEAEWEYACRAGSTTEYSSGSELFCADARIFRSTHTGLECPRALGSRLVPVGGYAPNAFGLYDMHGNVSEFCLDSLNSYGSSPVTDPFFTGGFYRMTRGGQQNSGSYECRSAKRRWVTATGNGPNNGFRVVLGPILVP